MVLHILQNRRLKLATPLLHRNLSCHHSPQSRNLVTDSTYLWVWIVCDFPKKVYYTTRFNLISLIVTFKNVLQISRNLNLPRKTIFQ